MKAIAFNSYGDPDVRDRISRSESQSGIGPCPDHSGRCTASESNHEYLRSLGVVPVTYGDGLVDCVHALIPEGVDAALDAAGRLNLMFPVKGSVLFSLM